MLPLIKVIPAKAGNQIHPVLHSYMSLGLRQNCDDFWLAAMQPITSLKLGYCHHGFIAGDTL